ncbi:GAF domain-containing protein [Streptomyces sp. p1417]|uniref:GAF domain-containing protein n=1 Tax=Streptomyces typhae TaxID=2681492 RepID=A0A6L6X9A5_9ACTN|nr:helix-turn-helix domain-containing protein [Streptomyces typhae]MVO90434.1 GAF domain-containing protein [Streptomyces typhae]
MSQVTANLSGVHTYLELLAARAPRSAFSRPTTDARRGGAPPHVLDELERAKELALGIEQRTTDLDRRKNELAVLIDTARELAEQEDLDALLTAMVRRSRLLLHCDMAWVMLLDLSGQDSVCVRANDGAIADRNGTARIPAWQGLSAIGSVARSAVWTGDYLRDDTIQRSEQVESIVLEEGLTAVLAVPLRVGDNVVGVLFGGDRGPRSYTADEVALMSTLADYGSAAVKWLRAVTCTHGRVADLTTEVDRLRARDRSRQQTADRGGRLLELATEGIDTAAFATAVSEALGGSVWLRGERDDVVAHSGRPWEGDEEELAAATFTARSEQRNVELPGGVTVAPVRVNDQDLGALVLRCHEAYRKPDPALVRYAVRAAGILAVLNRSGESDDRKVRDEALEDLINGLPSSRRWHRRLQRLGIDLSTRHAVIVTRVQVGDRHRLSTWASTFVWLRGGAKTIHDGHLILLLPHADPREAARDVMQRLGEMMGRPVPAGAASAHGGPKELIAAYQEAVVCLDVLTGLGKEDTATPATVDELGFVGMLLGGNRDIGAFIEQTLGPIISYDEQRSTNLAATLEAYFAAGASPTHAAEALQVHPNTVGRRLERIGQLLGPDWQQPGPSLELQLALRLHKVGRSLDGRPAPGAQTG